MCVQFVDIHHRNEENPYFTFLLVVIQFPRGACLWKSALCDATNCSDTSLRVLTKTVFWVLINVATLLPWWKNTKKEAITIRGPLKVNAEPNMSKRKRQRPARKRQRSRPFLWPPSPAFLRCCCVSSSNKRTIKCNTCCLLKKEREKR